MTTNPYGDLPEMSQDGPATVKVGDLLIDESTGEVLEWPAGLHGDRIEYLTRLYVEAQRAQKAWEDACNTYKAALGKLLEDANLPVLRTPYGTAGWRSRTDRRGRPERIADIARRHELTRAQSESIWMCAAYLDARRLDALAEAGVIPLDVLGEIIEAKTVRWVQVTPPRPAPPAMERGAAGSART